ncbi:MAG: hypothetical protein U9R65_19610 [Pseudomonadota bacterium]|nr:hypothetical protein [Pseudomonadota bacterium]
MATPTTSFKLKGPMFETGAQVSLGFAEAVNRGLLDLATFEGANRVKEELYPGHGRVTGKLRGQVMASKVQDYLVQVDAGEAQYGSNLIYSSWVEGISSRNRARPGFPGYGMFQNAYDHINNNPQLYEDYIGDALIEAFD